MRMTRAVAFATTALSAVLLPVVPADVLPAETTYRELRETRPDGRTIAAEKLVLERDAFRFTFESGTFHLLRPVGGRTVGAVFLGQGTLSLEPVDARERRHLGLLAGGGPVDRLEDRFKAAVLLFADDTAAELLAAGALTEGGPDAAAGRQYDTHLARQRDTFHTNFQLRLLVDLLNGRAGEAGVFLAFLDLERNPPSLAAVDPLGADYLRLGIGGPEETALYVAGTDNRGFAYLAHRRELVASGQAGRTPPRRLADALDYRVETTIGPDNRIEGVTVVTLRTAVAGLRVLPLQLLSSLRIAEAVLLPEEPGGAEVPLFFVQEKRGEDSDPAVVFAEPQAEGQQLAVRVRYAGGDVLEEAGDGNYTVDYRTSWYPNLGFGDRATFELTYRLPPKREVVSVGDPVQQGERDGRAVSVWKAAQPIAVAGFNYGAFKLIEERDEHSGVKVQVFTNPGTPDIIQAINGWIQAMSARRGSEFAADVVQGDLGYEGYVPGSFGASESFNVNTTSLAQAARTDGVNAVRLFHTVFGPLPYDRVAVTQQSQWFFGQAWPQLIYLPYLAFMGGTQRAQLGLSGTAEFVESVGIHEMAHQWWGHLVGWQSYRDQWLSEGFAEFSTALALEQIEGPAAYDHFWKRAREHITRKTGAVANHQAGPITQGARLATGRAPGAYEAMVYSKGAFVLHMLRMMMRDTSSQSPDGRFFAMLQDFARTWAGRDPSTADFRDHVQKHMVPELNARRDGKIDWFFEQWVEGIEIPSYHVDIQIEKAGKDQYRIHGEVGQRGVSEGFLALVPLYIDLGKGQVGMFGRAPFKGEMTHRIDQTVTLPKKPRRVVANARFEVLALDAP